MLPKTLAQTGRPSYISIKRDFPGAVPVRASILIALATALIVATPRTLSADVRDDARAQVEFGIGVAQRELWEEAQYRWKRATEIDPTYPAAWNNLGIAYEQKGMFEEALEAYEEALDLAPDDINIQQNYDLFREIYDRISEDDR